MRTFRSWGVRLLSLFRKRQLDARLDEELRFHLEMQAREHEARGMSPEAARRAALAADGPGWSVESLKEEIRERRGVPALEILGQDLRYALRMMRKSPVFTAVALLSLAFGIGTNSAIFSVVDALLLKSLPVPDAERLVVLRHVEGGAEVTNFSYPAYRQLADSATACTGVVAVTFEFTAVVRPERQRPAGGGGTAGDSGADAVETASTELVSGNLFSVLGGAAVAGRTFTAAEDDVPGAHPVAVLGYEYWQRRFGRDPGVVGQTLMVNGAPLTVVGVAPRGFNGTFVDGAPDVYVPITMRDRLRYHRNMYTDGPEDDAQPVWNQVNVHWLQLLARRRPGVSIRQANAVLGVIFERTKQAQLATHPDPETRRMVAAQTLVLAPGARGMANWREELTRPLLILGGAAGLVLLIACTNLASLLLARADRRQQEMAVRLGIGAGQGRLLRQLLTESLLLAGLGSALGLLFAAWGSRVLLGLVSSRGAPVRLDVALDPRQLAFAAAAALLTGVGFGLAPALRATRVDLAASLKEGGARSVLSGGAGRPGAAGGAGRAARFVRAGAAQGGGAGWSRSGRRRRLLPLGRALVAAQIALSLLLLIGAGLFVRSLQNLVRMDPGFASDRLMAAEVNPGQLGYDEAHLTALYDRLVERLEAMPGVRAASLSQFRLLASGSSAASVELPGAAQVPGHPRIAHVWIVTPHYFAATGMPLLRGRGFTARDRKGAPKAATVNQALVRSFFPDRSGLGERFGFEVATPRDYEIVGVVRDAKYNQLGEKTPPMIYLPVAQNPDALRDVEVRTASAAGAAAIARELRRAVAEVEPKLAVMSTLSMSEQLDRSLARERAIARLTGFFGGLALLLSAIGLYGVMSYSVARRTGEIGLRMALGAPRRRVLAMVLGETARLIAIGVATGLAAALATTRLAASQLHGLTAFDPATVAVATLVLVAVALLAGFLPARRAADTSPMTALRYE
jgi:ABC-type antimicrobial peptide transport system permease subunit